MKKILTLAISLLCILGLSACSTPTQNSGNTEKKEVIKVVATLEPHSRILEAVKPQLEAKGFSLEVIVVDDYYVPNRSLNDGEADANYFQHVPFFEGEVKAHSYAISNVAGIHIEPFGFYSQSIKNINELKEGAKVVISNSPADNGRILNILQQNGLIKIKEGVKVVDALLADIVENPKKLEFIEVKPELLTLSLQNNEGDLVAINGNYAISAGLNPTKDALLLEKGNAENPYVNILAVRSKDVDSNKTKALVEVLTSEETKNFISKTYADGSVVPASK